MHTPAGVHNHRALTRDKARVQRTCMHTRVVQSLSPCPLDSAPSLLCPPSFRRFPSPLPGPSLPPVAKPAILSMSPLKAPLPSSRSLPARPSSSCASHEARRTPFAPATANKNGVRQEECTTVAAVSKGY